MERARGKLRDIKKQLETAKAIVKEEEGKLRLARMAAELEASKVQGVVEDPDLIDEDHELLLI